MKRQVKTGLWAVAALVAAVVVALVIDWGPGEPPPRAPAGPSGPGIELPAPVLTEPGTPPAPAAARARTAPTIDWVGDTGITTVEIRPEHKPAYRGQLVVGPARKPLAHAALRLTHTWLDTVLPEEGEDTSEARSGRHPLLDWRGETSDYGHFAVPFVPLRGDLFLLIDPGGPASDVLMLRRAMWSKETIDLGVIVLEERGSVRGHIAGRGVAGARVRAVDLPLTNEWVVSEQRERALGGASAVAKQRLWMSSRRIAAMPDWIQRRDRVLPFPETMADRSGRFSLPAVRPGKVRLIVQTDRAGDLERDVTIESGRTTTVELQLDEAPVSLLEVTGVDGEPVDVDVIADSGAGDRDEPRAVLPPRRTMDGMIWIDTEALEGGQVFVRRHRRWPWESYQARPKERGTGFEIELKPLGSFSVRVQNLRNALVANAEVRLLTVPASMGAGGAALPASLQPEEAEPGRWQSPPVPIGSYRVLVRAEGYAPAFTLLPASNPQLPAYDIDLFPVFEMGVRVVDASGTPVPGAVVQAAPHGPDRRNRNYGGTRWRSLVPDAVSMGVTGSDGEVWSAGFWDNSFSFEAIHPRLGRGLTRVHLPRADTVVEVRVDRAGGLLGTIVEDGEPPAESLLVQMRPTRELWESINGSLLLTKPSVRVDDEGRFAMRDVWPGRWKLRVVRRHDDPDPLLVREVWVWPGSTEVIDLELGESGAWGDIVRGRVRLNGGPPHDLVAVLQRGEAERADWIRKYRARIEAYFRMPGRDKLDAEDRRQMEAELQAMAARVVGPVYHETKRLDREGRFEFKGVPRGMATLSIRRRSGGKAEALAVRAIPSKRDGELELEVEIHTGTVRAQLLTADGVCRDRELTAAFVGAETPMAYRLVSDSGGEVVLREVPAGDYELRLGAAADAPRVRCSVVAGQDRAVQLILETPSGK